MNQFTVFSDGNGSNADKVFDQGTTGTYSTTNVESCFIGIDMGS